MSTVKMNLIVYGFMLIPVLILTILTKHLEPLLGWFIAGMFTTGLYYCLERWFE